MAKEIVHTHNHNNAFPPHKIVSLPSGATRAIVSLDYGSQYLDCSIGFGDSKINRQMYGNHVYTRANTLFATDDDVKHPYYTVSCIMPPGEIKGVRVGGRPLHEVKHSHMILTEAGLFPLFGITNVNADLKTAKIRALDTGHSGSAAGSICWGNVVPGPGLKELWSQWWRSGFYSRRSVLSLVGAESQVVKKTLLNTFVEIETECDGIFVSAKKNVLKMAGRSVTTHPSTITAAFARPTKPIQRTEYAGYAGKKCLPEINNVAIGRAWRSPDGKDVLIQIANDEYDTLLMTDSGLQEFSVIRKTRKINKTRPAVAIVDLPTK